MMKPYLKIRVAILMSFTLAAFWPANAQSYVLQGPHIIQLMTEKLGQADSLFVSQRVIFYNVEPQPDVHDEENSGRPDIDITDQPGDLFDASQETVLAPPAASPPILLEESIRYLFSQAFRSDIISDANQRIYVYNAGQTLVVIDGRIAHFTESRFDLYKDLLLYRSRETLSERLVNLGIDVTISSIGKVEDRIALVVGAEFPDETAAQVWIDKETFQPLRMMIPAPYGNHTGLLEIRYANWQKIEKTWYPMQIEFIQDGMIVRAVEVNHYQINPRFSEDIFDIARLMSEYRQAESPSEGSSNDKGLSEVQKTIEEFKKIFE
jgi:hypothetical protein